MTVRNQAYLSAKRTNRGCVNRVGSEVRLEDVSPGFVVGKPSK